MFKNKVVIITGGSSGIGAATAECFSKEGAAVVIVGRNEDRLKAVAQKCKALGGNVLTIRADVTKDVEAKTIVEKTINKFGKLNVLVNNAGILRFSTILESNVLETYDKVMNTNLRPVVLITSLAVPHLTETKGTIINISSVASTKVILPGLGAYCMSKAAMDQFTKSSAIELASLGVRVNSVNPGPVTTEMAINTAKIIGTDADDIGNMTPLGRISDAEEIGDIIVYLASDKARSVTGSCYVIDNGMLLK